MKFYLPALDLLRFFAFLMVFTHHVFPQEPERYLLSGISHSLSQILCGIVLSGSLGVDVFFCLSAYLITRILLEEEKRTGTISLLSFWLRRILRIWPLYFAFLGVVLFLVPKYLVPNEDLSGYVRSYLLFYGNWICAFWGYPHSTAVHLWSVSIEEQFYFLWPLAILAFGRNQIRVCASILLFFSWICRLTLVLIAAEHPAFWCNSLAHLDPIIFGILFADQEQRGSRLPVQLSSLPVVFCAIAIPLSLFTLFQSESFEGWPAFFLMPTAAFGSVCLLAFMLRHDRKPPDTGFFSEWARLLLYLGKISYGLYVWHFLVIRFLRLHLNPERLGIPDLSCLMLQFLVGGVLTILLASLSYENLEKPFLGWKEKISKRG